MAKTSPQPEALRSAVPALKPGRMHILGIEDAVELVHGVGELLGGAEAGLDPVP